MKTTCAALTLIALGYLAFDHRVREYMMAYPWLCALTFVAPTYAYGFWRMFLHVASICVRNPNNYQTEPDIMDLIAGFVVGLLWPVAFCGNVLFKGLSRLTIDYVNKPIVDYAKKNVDKNS